METPENDGPVWRKSRWTTETGGNCVEVLLSTGGALVRDSKGSKDVVLSFSRAAWGDFLAFVKSGDGTP